MRQSTPITCDSVSTTDTLEDNIDAGENDPAVCEEVSTDYVIVAVMRSSMELAIDDGSGDEDDEDPTPDVPCKEVP